MLHCSLRFLFFFFNDTATTEIYTLSLHDALPIYTVNLPSGHQLSISFRNTLNALSWLQGTSMVLMIGSSITFSFWVSCVAQSQHHKKTRLRTRTSPDTSVDHRARRA